MGKRKGDFMNAVWAVVIIIVVTVCDALRDRWITRNVGWWQWHIVKWIAFYTPLVVLTVLFIPWVWWPPLVIVAEILWRVVNRYRS